MALHLPRSCCTSGLSQIEQRVASSSQRFPLHRMDETSVSSSLSLRRTQSMAAGSQQQMASSLNDALTELEHGLTSSSSSIQLAAKRIASCTTSAVERNDGARPLSEVDSEKVLTSLEKLRSVVTELTLLEERELLLLRQLASTPVNSEDSSDDSGAAYSDGNRSKRKRLR